RVELQPAVVGQRSVGAQAGQGRAVVLERLGALPCELRAPEPLGCTLWRLRRMIEVPVRLVGVQRLALPGELAIERSDPRFRVDPELELAVEVVAIVRDALDHPELPLRERPADRCPADALPAVLLEPRCRHTE